MDEALLVNVLERKNKLGGVEPSHALAEDAFATQQIHKVATWHVLHHKVKMPGVLSR